MAKQLQGQDFTGMAPQMRESPWLASEDIAMFGGSKDLQIEKVVKHLNVEFAQGRKKPEVYAVSFVGVKRQLVLNATNRKSIVKLHGLKVADWAGKRVCLFVTENKGRIGEPLCIRIRAASPEPASKTVEQLEAEAADRAAQQKEGK